MYNEPPVTEGIIVIFFGLMDVSTPKTEGKLHHARNACCISFPSVFGVDTSINPKKYYNDSLSFYFDAFKR